MALASSLDPACRLICLALISSATLFASAPFAAIVACGSVAALRFEGIGLLRILRESVFILGFALFAGLLRMLGVERAEPAVLASGAGIYGLKLLAAFLAGRLFYASTRMSELRDAATRIVRMIPFLRRFDIGLSLSLVLGNVPLIFEEWRDSLEAARSRGLSRRPVIALQARFLAAFLRRLMLRAIAIPQALAARGWSKDRHLTPASWETRDRLAMLVCCAAFIGTLLRLV
jgi:energy-coupling factor transporter transmembrane protein EcfT